MSTAHEDEDGVMAYLWALNVNTKDAGNAQGSLFLFPEESVAVWMHQPEYAV